MPSPSLLAMEEEGNTALPSAVITLREAEDGGVDVAIEFDPPHKGDPDNDPLVHNIAVSFVGWMKELLEA